MKKRTVSVPPSHPLLALSYAVQGSSRLKTYQADHKFIVKFLIKIMNRPHGVLGFWGFGVLFSRNSPSMEFFQNSSSVSISHDFDQYLTVAIKTPNELCDFHESSFV